MKNIHQNVPFYSQRLNADNYQDEGFIDFKDALYWSKRICGLACLKMAIQYLLKEEKSVPLKELLDKGLSLNAFTESLGWIHNGLINIGSSHGLASARESIGDNLERIDDLISEGNLIIVSVTVGFEAGKVYQKDDGTEYIMKKGGHLILVLGTKKEQGIITELLVHHPSSQESYEYQNHWVPREVFLNSFSEAGNIMYFRK